MLDPPAGATPEKSRDKHERAADTINESPPGTTQDDGGGYKDDSSEDEFPAAASPWQQVACCTQSEQPRKQQKRGESAVADEYRVRPEQCCPRNGCVSVRSS